MSNNGCCLNCNIKIYEGNYCSKKCYNEAYSKFLSKSSILCACGYGYHNRNETECNSCYNRKIWG